LSSWIFIKCLVGVEKTNPHKQILEALGAEQLKNEAKISKWRIVCAPSSEREIWRGYVDVLHRLFVMDMIPRNSFHDIPHTLAKHVQIESHKQSYRHRLHLVKSEKEGRETIQQN
jgi:hypothetical protein